MLVSIGLAFVALGILTLSLEAVGTSLTLFALAFLCVRVS